MCHPSAIPRHGPGKEEASCRIAKQPQKIASRLRVKVLVALLLMAATAGSRSTAWAAGLLLADGGLGGALEIEEHSVHVTINNGVAVTDVTQVFRNLEDRQVEALYTFPVPKGASVSNFSMWIGGQEMVGEVVEKKRAREIYESYKARRVDPGLLEQTDYKTFEMRIFPIAPRGEQKVQITYYQEAEVDDDWATYVYPLATVTRRDITARTKGKFAFAADVKSEIPIAAIESPSHEKDFVMASHGERYAQASLETSGGDLNHDLVLAYKLSRPRTGIDLIASKEMGDDGYFLLTLTVGEDLAKLDKGMDYVFVLDVSGSMEQEGKLRLSRGSIGAFIDELDPEDRFEIVTFNIQPTTLFKKLAQATDESKASARTFLESQEAKGGTVLKPAVDTAYRYCDPDRALNVVILSDGMTEQRERAALHQLIRQRPSSARVFCIGVGNEVNRGLLESLAEGAGGLAAFISRGDDFGRQAKAFRRKLTRPAATNLELAFDGASVYDLEPQKLPNLYHGAPLRVYGRYKGQGKGTVTVRGDVGSKELKKSMDLELPKEDSSNPEIERMWAWHKVDRLLKEADRGNAPPRLLDDIVWLGESYSIATEYTSFLVLENDREYQRWKIDRKNLARTRRDRDARQKLLVKLEEIRSESLTGLGPQEAEAEAPGAVPASAHPVSTRTPAPGPRPGPSQAPPPPQRRRDPFPNFGGTGPVGPLFAGLAAWLLRRKRNTAQSNV